MKKLFTVFFAMVLLFSSLSIPANAQDNVNVSVTAVEGKPVEEATPAPVATSENKVEFIGKDGLADSLKAILPIITDPEAVKVVNEAVQVLKSPPQGKDVNDWFNWLTGAVAAVTAIITLLLAKGKAIFNKLFKSS